MLSAGDRQLHRDARQIGYLSSSCDRCLATGRAARHVASSGRGDLAVDGICGACDGSGRWWFAEGRTFAEASAHLTDAELLVLLAPAATEALHGGSA